MDSEGFASYLFLVSEQLQPSTYAAVVVELSVLIVRIYGSFW
jgi:hypothetical protein